MSSIGACLAKRFHIVLQRECCLYVHSCFTQAHLTWIYVIRCLCWRLLITITCIPTYTTFTLWVSDKESWCSSHVLGCYIPETGGLCISVASTLQSFIQPLDLHSYSLMKPWWKYQGYPYVYDWSSVMSGAHTQTVQRQHLSSISATLQKNSWCTELKVNNLRDPPSPSPTPWHLC